MKKYVLLLLAAAMTFSSCKKSKDQNNGPCGTPLPECGDIMCIAYWYNFDFRVVDKATGADLVFGANPRYTVNDIKLFFDAAGTHPVPIVVDTPGKKFQTMTAREQVYLIINSQVYDVDIVFQPESCCSSKVKDLKIDNQVVCTCCADVIGVPVN
jgi:hypothetical protein